MTNNNNINEQKLKFVRILTLTDGSVVRLNDNESMECPICINGTMDIDYLDNEYLIYKCNKCQTEIKIPFTFIKAERIADENKIIDESDFGPNGYER